MLLILLLFITAPARAALYQLSESSVKIPSGQYVVIPSRFEFYRIVNILLHQKVSGYRVLDDTASLKLNKGDFLFPANADPLDAISRILNKSSAHFEHRSIPDGIRLPGIPISNPPRVGVYCGQGVTAGHLWHFYPMERCLVDVVFLKENDIGSIKDVDVICFPSGGRYSEFIPKDSQDYLKQLIYDKGMGFLGTCGGNVFGNQLSLLDAVLEIGTNGNPFGVAVNGYPPMRVETADHPAMLAVSDQIRPFYYWGQVFRRVGSDAAVLATYQEMRNTFRFDGAPYNGGEWKDMAGRPAAIAGHYGRGRVILSGPHPEVGEEQLFMDWIFFLAAGVPREDSMTAPEPVGTANPDQTTLNNLLSAAETFQTLAEPYASQVIPFWESRWKNHNTIGLPALLIFSDLWHRLMKIKKASTDRLIAPSKRPLPIGVLDIRRLEVASLAFSGLIPKLEKTIKMLKEKDRMSPNVREKISTERLFYPEYYFDFVENLKSVHLPLIEIDYLFQRHEMTTALNVCPHEASNSADGSNPSERH